MQIMLADSLQRLFARDPETLHDQYPLFRRLREIGPLFHYEPTDAWVASGYDVVRDDRPYGADIGRAVYSGGGYE